MNNSPFSLPINRYIEQLSSSSPTPGGGSTSAVVAALGASIAMMAGRISDRKNADIKLQSLLSDLLERIRVFEKNCLADMQSFQRVMDSLDQDKDDNELQAAIEEAAAVPFSLAKECARALESCQQLLLHIQDNVLSDLGCAVGFLVAASQGALLTMSINTQYVKKRDKVESWEREADALRKHINELSSSVLRKIEQRIETMHP